MRPDEWAQVKALFEAALEVPGADRERFLADATRDPVTWGSAPGSSATAGF
jgi:hypothetical protein